MNKEDSYIDYECGTCGNVVTDEDRKKIISQWLIDSRPTLPEIDVTKGYFQTENHIYHIMPDKMSIDRYFEYKWLQHEITFNRDIKHTYDEIVRLNKINTGQGKLTNPIAIMNETANTTFELANSLMAIKNKNIRQDKMFRLVALFCNREGEDITVYDEGVMLSKMQDWQDYGFDVDAFFLLCYLGLGPLKERFKYMDENQSLPIRPSKQYKK